MMSRDGVCVNCDCSPDEWRIVCPAVDPPQHLHRPHLLAVDPHQQLRGVPPPRYRQHRQSSGRHCNSKAHVLSHEQNGGAIEDIAVLAYRVTMPQAPSFSPYFLPAPWQMIPSQVRLSGANFLISCQFCSVQFLTGSQFDLCFEVVGSHTLNFRSNCD